MRAVLPAVRLRRQELDGVSAEHGEIAEVLLPHMHSPCIHRIIERAVAELMSANRKDRMRSDLQTCGNDGAAAFHAERSQQPAYAEQDTARVVAGHAEVIPRCPQA